jgi:PleD family two-component response regulator
MDVLSLTGEKHEAQAGKPEMTVEPFPEVKPYLVTTFAEHISISLASLNLRETLRYQAIRDPLTTLFNRRFMIESLERELNLS